MARIKQGVFSWEDVLAQRYQSQLFQVPLEPSNHGVNDGIIFRVSPFVQTNLWVLRTRQATSPLPFHALVVALSPLHNHSPNAGYSRVFRPSCA